MMTSDWDQALRTALCRTLEELCFLAPDVDAPSQRWDELPVEACAKVGFRGAMVGQLTIRLRGHALADITRDMLGAAETAAKADQSDCMAEIANVTCGTALPLLAGPREVFDVAPPEVFWGDDAHLTGELAGRARVGFDSGCAEVAVYLTGPRQP
ncbi:MAG: chemotaxis protein CheX [Myxococcales bacterium]|nr:chemotaxis protein CheX [Myxococcales bacterium]